MTRRVWQLALPAVVALVVHGTTPGGGFHYDDHHAVVDNPHLRLENLARFFVDPALFSADPQRGMYRPVLLSTYALGGAIHGGDPAGYLAVNLALHAANAALVAAIAGAWLGGGPALLAGCLFAATPAASEPAHYISARSDSLVAFFVLLALSLWLRGGTRSRVAGGLAAAAALWTKATAVVLAPLLLAIDRAREPTTPMGALLRRHAPLWGLTALWLAVSWSTRFLPRSLAASGPSAGEHLGTQVKAIGYYVRWLAWPVGGSVEPAFTAASGIDAPVAAAGLLGLTGVVVAVRLWRVGARRGVLLAAWAALALLPTSLIPLNVLVNERRAYLAAAAVAVGLAALLARLPGRARAAGVVAVVLLGLLGHQRGQAWASELSLWQDAVARGPMMPRAHLQLADAHREAAGRSARPETAAQHLDAARGAYARVIALEPRQQMLALRAHNGLAILEEAAGELTAAEARLRGILEVHPEFADAHINLGNIYYRRARQAYGTDSRTVTAAIGAAIEHYRGALEIAPQLRGARLNLAACYHLAGDLEQAQAAYEALQRQAPEDGTVALNLGLLYRQRATGDDGRRWLEAAAAQLDRARHLLPGNRSAQRAWQDVRDALERGALEGHDGDR